MKTLEALRALQKETKAEVYFVGGFVRDYLRNKKNNDYDIVVRKLPMPEIISFLEPQGHCKIVHISGAEGVADVEILLFRGSKDKNVAQIALPRRGLKQIPYETNTLRQDAKYRDFRINALYLPIDFKSRDDVIDPIGRCKEDIKDRIIASENKDLFKMSPIRLLRMISLAAKTGYTINESLLEVAQEQADLIIKAPVESIRKELDIILLSNKPSKYIKIMRKAKLLGYVMPELEACVGVSQDKRYHKYDVFTHCIKTCDNTEPDLTMRLAGLLHDVGKPGTWKIIDGHVTFHKHEMLSVKLARQFLDRLRYDGRTKEKVLHLVRMHMYHYTREYTDTAIRRFIKRAGVNSENIGSLSDLSLFKLRQAERLGNGLKKEPVTKRQLDFEERIRKVFEAGGGLEIKDLDIDGHIIMEAFGIRQGEEVGKILNYLLGEVQKDAERNSRLILIEMVLDYLKGSN